MNKLTDSQNEPSTNKTQGSVLRNGIIGILMALVAYLFYHQYTATSVEQSKIELNSEEIKMINTDLGKLRDDIRDNRTSIQEKQSKIDALKEKLEVIKTEKSDQNEDERKALMAMLNKQISTLVNDKDKLQTQITKTINEYEGKMANFQKILKQKDSLINNQRSTIRELEDIVSEKKTEIQRMQVELKETGDIIDALDDKIHVTISNVGFYANGFDDADDDLEDSNNKKNIAEVGVFYSLSRELKSGEKLVAELSLPNKTVIGKKEYGAAELLAVEREGKKKGVERPMSIRIQKGSLEMPLKVNFYIKIGSGKQRSFLVDSKLIPSIKAKQIF